MSREVAWARAVRGRMMPVDPDPYEGTDEAANLALYRGVDGGLRARVLTKDGEGLRPFERRGLPHFASCPALLAQRNKVPGVSSLAIARAKKGRR